MMAFWKTVLAFVFLPLYIGGSSRSSSATTTNYTTTDDRVAAAEGAIVQRLEGSDVASGSILKVSGSGNTITSADPTIVKEAFNYARERDALAGESLEKILGKSGEIVAAQAGKFSERTIIILAAAAGAVLLMFMKRGKA